MSDMDHLANPPAESEYCSECDDYVLPIEGGCPVCGTEVGIPDSETIKLEDDDE